MQTSVKIISVIFISRNSGTGAVMFSSGSSGTASSGRVMFSLTLISSGIVILASISSGIVMFSGTSCVILVIFSVSTVFGAVMFSVPSVIFVIFSLISLKTTF